VITVPLFEHHKGKRCAPPSALTLFFRRALRLVRRKPAVPGPDAIQGSAPGDAATGTATTLLADARPVMGDAMIADVREQWNGWHDGTPVPTFTPATAEADRAAYVSSQVREAAFTRDPETLRQVIAGLSPDCANGLHAPLCSGRNCTCSCHTAARTGAPGYGQAPVARVLESERLNQVMMP